MTISIIALAQTDFEVFYELARQSDAKVRIHKLSHHQDWITTRSVFKNLIWWIYQLTRVIPSLVFGRVIIFGTALSRLLWPIMWWRPRVVWVINEMTDLSNPTSAFARYDRFLLRRAARLFVSSPERAAYVKEHCGRDVTGILPNVPHLVHPQSPQMADRHGAMYSGIITRHRFPDTVLDELDDLPFKVDFFGLAADHFDWARHDNVAYRGHRSAEDVRALHSTYRFGILSYPVTDVNNDLCAPIKVYEYVFYGCVCLSINRNRGLERWFSQFPALMAPLSEWRYSAHSDAFAQQRESFLRAADHEVQESSRRILTALAVPVLTDRAECGPDLNAI